MVQFGPKGKIVGEYDPVMVERKEEGEGSKILTTYMYNKVGPNSQAFED